MRITKQKLYPKLKGFFDKAYLYSEEEGYTDLRLVKEADEKRYVAALKFRYDYAVVDGKPQLTFYNHIQTDKTMCGEFCSIWICQDVFSIRLLEQLKFVEIDISDFEGYGIIMDYYHNHFVNHVQRKFDRETD